MLWHPFLNIGSLDEKVSIIEYAANWSVIYPVNHLWHVKTFENVSLWSEVIMHSYLIIGFLGEEESKNCHLCLCLVNKFISNNNSINCFFLTNQFWDGKSIGDGLRKIRRSFSIQSMRQSQKWKMLQIHRMLILQTVFGMRNRLWTVLERSD